MLWRVAADVVLVLHLGFVAFVVAGGVLTWRWATRRETTRDHR